MGQRFFVENGNAKNLFFWEVIFETKFQQSKIIVAHTGFEDLDVSKKNLSHYQDIKKLS